LTDDLHARQEAAVEDLASRAAGVEQLSRQTFDAGAVAGDQ
jgi:hypothetical protein